MGSPRNVVEVNTREAGVELCKVHRYEDSKAVARRNKEAWLEAEEIMEDVYEWEKAYRKLNSQPKDSGAVRSDTTSDLIMGGAIVVGVVGGAACFMSVVCGVAVGAGVLTQSMFDLAA